MVARLSDCGALAEDKESEVERLKREKMGIIWLLIYMRSYLVKYADLRQSLEIADKEREIDLKEREALVYRADSLQREFEHINKLLQVRTVPFFSLYRSRGRELTNKLIWCPSCHLTIPATQYIKMDILTERRSSDSHFSLSIRPSYGCAS